MSAEPFTLNAVESATQTIVAKLAQRGNEASHEQIRGEVETLYLNLDHIPEVDELVAAWFQIEDNWGNIRWR
jgi:hypothetical protein